MWPSLFAESVSRNSCLEWDAVSAWDPIGKVCPTIQLDSGMYFPVEARWESASHFGGGTADVVSGWLSLGKFIPFLGLIMGRSFPLRTLWESASRSGRSNWDGFSG